MKPTLGYTVIVRNLRGPGSLDAPAIINRVWHDDDTATGPQLVNVHVMPDASEALCKTSVPLYDSREAAERYLATMVGHSPLVAFWPEREPQARAVAMRKAA